MSQWVRYNDILVLWGSFRTRYTKRKKHARENGEEKIDEKERVIILHLKNPLYVSGVRYNDVFVVWDNIELNLKKKKIWFIFRVQGRENPYKKES